MSESSSPWPIASAEAIPDTFRQAVQQCLSPAAGQSVDGRYITQLLWQRGIRETDRLAGYLNAAFYQPASAQDFGREMQSAIQRLQQAISAQETIGIWGDFDADGVTATAVLWEGLGQFFPQQQRLFYYIPNRLTESHGLSVSGLDQLKAQGCQLIVTCDTGSTNLAEIQYAHGLGMEVIVTDHHTLPPERPPIVAILNPRYLPPEHPLADLSGVAVAYKLVEALYEALPDLPQQPLEQLLDLVAIGLIADLVALKQDCRYLAQRGIEQLKQQANPKTATRPGVTRLLELCRRAGDRPTDISFGLGPRINAVSRIQGDAHFCVELLTSQDKQRCRALAEATEIANARRKELQKDLTEQVKLKLAQVDLSTTAVIVLWDEQWSLGILGLVAGGIAQEYGRPTILLSVDSEHVDSEHVDSESEATPSDLLDAPPVRWARGSARSVQGINLYALVQGQTHLLHRFGGHPFAAGLMLAVENLPLFSAAINQQLLQTTGGVTSAADPGADLCVTVQELGLDLYRELRLIEPCGMGNPPPRLLIRNCWFEVSRHQNLKDWKGHKVKYIQTKFTLWDDSSDRGFAGIWWGHYAYELPTGRCAAIVELENNPYRERYEVRLIDVHPQTSEISPTEVNAQDWPRSECEQKVLDWRSAMSLTNPASTAVTCPSDGTALLIKRCPTSWTDWQTWVRRSQQTGQPLALAYPAPQTTSAQHRWHLLVGIAKYLCRTGRSVSRQQLCDRLDCSGTALEAGLQALEALGLQVSETDRGLTIMDQTSSRPSAHPIPSVQTDKIGSFLMIVREEQFFQQYFYQVPLEMLINV